MCKIKKLRVKVNIEACTKIDLKLIKLFKEYTNSLWHMLQKSSFFFLFLLSRTEEIPGKLMTVRMEIDLSSNSNPLSRISPDF